MARALRAGAIDLAHVFNFRYFADIDCPAQYSMSPGGGLCRAFDGSVANSESHVWEDASGVSSVRGFYFKGEDPDCTDVPRGRSPPASPPLIGIDPSAPGILFGFPTGS